MKIDLKFFENSKKDNELKIITNKNIKIGLNIYNMDNYTLMLNMSKINNLSKVYNNINRINLVFDKDMNENKINMLISKLSDIFYKYNNLATEIKLYNIYDENMNLMKELEIYKDIVMDPNKNPISYLEYIKSRVPKSYNINIFDLSKNNNFPLSKAVGLGSKYPSFFVHIYPKKNINKKNIYLIGKAVTFDSGGLNIKSNDMYEMKIDMTGSAIIVSILNLLHQSNNDNCNYHLILPIVENMISNNAVRPGSVVKSMNNVKIEIIDTDAEGRLCLVDALEYIQMELIHNKDNLIIDIATLTGNTMSISSGISSLIMSNKLGEEYVDDIMQIGEEIGEYLDYLKIRKEYLTNLTSKVADIKNICYSIKADCVLAGSFLNYFVSDKIPWIHIDVGVSTFINNMANSYGINLLYEFLKKMK